MTSVSVRKVLRDLWLARGRTTALVIALAVSLVAVGTVLGTRGILVREMPRSFRESHPASATIVVAGGIDRELLERVRRHPGIAMAERRALVRARIEATPGHWCPLALFVVDDFESMAIQTVTRVDGAWPPTTGEMLLEKTSAAMLDARIGSELRTLTASGTTKSLRASGIVVDAGLAPAWQEQAAYAYVTVDTLAWLELPPTLDQIVLTVDEPAFESAHIEQVTAGLAQFLRERGADVREVRIPPPGQHPHQRLMNGLTLVLLVFSVLALVLSVLLVATVISGMLTRHVRQIGSMKAIGASPARIACMYSGMVGMMGALAALIAIVPTTLGARAAARLGADLSNVVLESTAVPASVYVVLIALGALAPLLAAAIPIAAASRMTVREAISDVHVYRAGSSSERAGSSRIAGALGPSMVLALRQALRRRRRLALSVLLLAAGGATFITGRNVAAASDRALARGDAMPGYDIEISLGRPQPVAALLEIARSVPGVEYVEPVESASVSTVASDAAPVARTHKDGGHGAQRLYGLPADTRFRPAVLSGRWLEDGETDAIVVAPGELARLGAALGGTARLALEGRVTTWRIVGVVRGIGLGGHGGLYVSDTGFARSLDREGLVGGLRVAATRHDAASQRETAQALDAALARSGICVAGVTTSERWDTILRNHVALVQGALSWLGVVLGCVGALMLASAMGTSVAERTREFGVMQALGATPARVVWIVVAEALFVGVSSFVVGVALGLAGSSLVGDLVGTVVFGAPLDLTVEPAALVTWLVVTLLGCIGAAAVPAAAASRRSIRDTLAHE